VLKKEVPRIPTRWSEPLDHAHFAGKEPQSETQKGEAVDAELFVVTIELPAIKEG
jgi:hypothetical protein